MKPEITLLILAAGKGSRYGGQKQLESIGPKGEFLFEYSIYDAVKVGFSKIIFILSEENYETFKNNIEKRKINTKIKIEYIIQKLKHKEIPKERTKPLGTAHAILSAKNKINNTFVVINADDFYGFNSFQKAKEFIQTKPNKNGIIGFKITETLSENGPVKRGILEMHNNKIKTITESKIENKNGKITITELKNQTSYEITENTYTSMGMIIFTVSIFKYLEKGFKTFLKNNKDLINSEYYITDVINKIIENKEEVELIRTNSKWTGLTYIEDKKETKKYIEKLIKEEKYPNTLWN